MDYQSFFETDLGRGSVHASATGITCINLPQSCPGEAITRNHGLTPSALTENVADMLKSYFKGIRQPFENVPLDLVVSGQFRKRILEMIRAIPFGEVRSYGEVAAIAGSAGAARAVGGAMAANPIPVIIPCHRVVAGDGRLVGFSAPGGLALKKFLLELEGAEFKGEVMLIKK